MPGECGTNRRDERRNDMSSEYEGHHWMPGGDAFWQVKAHQAMVRELLANV